MSQSATEANEYDLIVLGAAARGENVADRASQGGLTAALVEHELVGGECPYWACMASKALLCSAQALRAARQVPGAAQAIGGGLDVQTVARRDSFTSNWSDEGQVQWVDVAGISLAHGAGGDMGQVTEHLRRRRVGEGGDAHQEERRQCGRVDSRAGAA